MIESNRWCSAVGLVITWMALGWLFRLGTFGYQLLGVPLCLAFQIFVARRPIIDCWVRDAQAFRLDRMGVFLAIGLAVAPCAELVAIWPRGGWALRFFLAAAVTGAPVAAFALRRINAGSRRSLLWCFGTAGVIGSMWMLGFGIARHQALPIEPWRLRIFVSHWLLVIPAGFILEEVAFRGVLDSHVSHPGDRRPLISALFVSAFWGWWHVPILPTVPGWVAPLAYPVTHALIGIPLSLCWRRSGNLAVPVLVHAFVDAVRDAYVLA